MYSRILLAVIGAALFGVPPALAHHSNVAFEVNKVITLTGVVKEFRWANPHTWIGLTVDDGKGGKVDWAIEGRCAGGVAALGMDPDFHQARGHGHGRFQQSA